MSNVTSIRPPDDQDGPSIADQLDAIDTKLTLVKTSLNNTLDTLDEARDELSNLAMQIRKESAPAD